MQKIIAIVEGQTEEKFISNVVNPYLENFQKKIIPRLIITNKKINNLGGLNSYDNLKNLLIPTLKETNNTDIFITTFFDFYQLPNNFPGYNELENHDTAINKINHLENCMSNDIDNKRFIPYIQLHEFEALLFSSTVGFVKYYNTSNRFIDGINQIVNEFENPEDINNRPDLAPSKRLESLFSNHIKQKYKKTYHGDLIAVENGLNVCLEKCPHFTAWIERLIAI